MAAIADTGQGHVDESTTRCAADAATDSADANVDSIGEATASLDADAAEVLDSASDESGAEANLDLLEIGVEVTEQAEVKAEDTSIEVGANETETVQTPADVADVDTDGDGGDTIDAAEVAAVPFVWPTPPLANPILPPGLPNCATQAAVPIQLDGANCATVTSAELIAAGSCTGNPGFVYVLGGEAYPPQIDFDGEKSATPFRLDLASGQWTSLPPMPMVRLSPKAVWLPIGLTVLHGLPFFYGAPEKWPGKYQAKCADALCLYAIMQYSSSGWSTTPKQINTGSAEYGSAARIGCDIMATQFSTIHVYSGTTFNLKVAVPLAAQYTLDSEQALVPWGDWFALVTRPHWQSPIKTVPVLLLGKNGEKLATTLPPLPCPALFPRAWTNGEHLFVSDRGAVQEKDWQSKGCVGVVTTTIGASLRILRWTGTHWTKAPDADVSSSPQEIVDTPVGAIAIGVDVYKGKFLPWPDQTECGVMVQDKKTFIWKDDVYPPMPHGKTGATAVWAPK